MIVYIKNMVCVRCKMAVQTILKELNIEYISIELGRVKIAGELNSDQLRKLGVALKYYELELMDNKKKILVESIKLLINEMLHSSNDALRLKFSEYLSKQLHFEYTYLANVFSETEGSTVEKFFILSKIERVKELLVYEGFSIKEIAFEMNYSSESHLCQQFKKVTGQTPSMYKKLFEKEGIAENNK